MSITAETAKEHAHDPAVLCCRAEAGITIEAANLEDPAIFDDLVDSGLLNLDGALTIEEVLLPKLLLWLINHPGSIILNLPNHQRSLDLPDLLVQL